MRTRKFIFSLLLFSFWYLNAATAQAVRAITLTDCYRIAAENYPLSKQKQLIQSSEQFSLENASKGYLPQLSLNGQATYQSAVTSLPIKLPNVSIQTLSKDQYKLYAEVYQPITEATVISTQKDMISLNARTEEARTDVELYKLNDRISQLYFGILLLQEQAVQTGLVQKDMTEARRKLQALADNGTALKSNVQVLDAELLKLEQKNIEIQAAKSAYLQMLGRFLNQELNDSTRLETPAGTATEANVKDSFRARPEMTLFDHQYHMLQIQNKYLSAKNLPRLGLFVQSGYGRPALNMLSNNFDFYYIGGLRFNWNFSGLYTLKNDRKQLAVNRSMIDVQREIFLFNNFLLSDQQRQEMNKYKELLKRDESIVNLRKQVTQTTKIQMENGIATASDFTRDINAEDQAAQNLMLHRIQMLMAQYNYQTTTGTNRNTQP